MDPSSVASKSGLQVNDVIIKMDNTDIAKMQDLVKYLYTIKKGDSVKSVIIRDGKKVNVEFKF